jgi:hypothetical protein
MSAPVVFFSGAQVAQNECATGEFALKGKPSGAKVRHCALPVAQRRKLGFTLQRGERGAWCHSCR